LIKEKHCPLFSEDNSKFLQALKNNDSNNPEIKEFRDELALRAEVEYKDDGEDEILLCLLQLKNLKLKERLDEISKQIKQAEEEKDSKKTAELTQEFHKLTKEL
jgi:hypothetical protein